MVLYDSMLLKAEIPVYEVVDTALLLVKDVYKIHALPTSTAELKNC